MSRHNAHVASNGERSAERIEAERVVVGELDAWRARMLPDPSAPLDAEALAQLVVSCLTTLGIDVPDFSVNTVHYYRRKDILDAPAGRTSALMPRRSLTRSGSSLPSFSRRLISAGASGTIADDSFR